MRDDLHVFTFPDVGDWRPATMEDAAAIGHDLVLYGNAFATEDGRRVDPSTVTVRHGKAYGGKVRLPPPRPAKPAEPTYVEYPPPGRIARWWRRRRQPR
jgi:hypothetical protein